MGINTKNEEINTKANRSHFSRSQNLEEILETLKSTILLKNSLHKEKKTQLINTINDLSKSPLGIHILTSQGANGYWTDHLMFPNKSGAKFVSNSDIEDFLYFRSPHVLAQREQYSIIAGVIRSLLKEKAIIASIPCGLMRDILEIDFSKLNSFRLIGVDLDSDSLDRARILAKEKKFNNLELLQMNAWNLNLPAKVDVISSIGLNVYESDSLFLGKLYTEFYNSLNPGGTFITSVLTTPPWLCKSSDWKVNNISHEDLLLEKLLHFEIFDVKWQNFTSLAKAKDPFYKAGFSEVSIIEDKNSAYPVIVCKK
ncbi:MAG: class I SAM-dependent methyltransferase [Chlamydiales bacterium]